MAGLSVSWSDATPSPRLDVSPTLDDAHAWIGGSLADTAEVVVPNVRVHHSHHRGGFVAVGHEQVTVEIGGPANRRVREELTHDTELDPWAIMRLASGWCSS